MKAKLKSDPRDVRYAPIDEALYPEQGEDEGMIFYRFWCRPNFVVYQKYKNGVMMGYTVYPEGKDIFQFESMVKYAESIQKGQTVCRMQSSAQ